MDVVRRTLSSLESAETLDKAAAALHRWAHWIPTGRRGSDFLSGSWLGHPMHPVLVLTPIGAWLSAGILDILPGQAPAARRLVLAGLVTIAPAALAGLVDLRELDRQQRRVGLVHVLANGTAAACYLASYLSRRRGRTDAGRAWGALGLTAVSVGGTLGGHLSYAQGAGVYRWQPERRNG